MEKKGKMKKSVDEIIKRHVIYSMTAGAIPIPIADFIAISAIQLDMIRQIAEFHSANYDADQGKSLASSIAGTSLAKIGASLVKGIPGIGTAAGISAQIILAGASSYALGKVFDAHFSGSKSLDDFNLDGMKKKYRHMMGKGKEFAKNLKSAMKQDDVFETIEKLKKLKDNGSITKEDFERTKKELLRKVSA